MIQAYDWWNVWTRQEDNCIQNKFIDYVNCSNFISFLIKYKDLRQYTIIMSSRHCIILIINFLTQLHQYNIKNHVLNHKLKITASRLLINAKILLFLLCDCIISVVWMRLKDFESQSVQLLGDIFKSAKNFAQLASMTVRYRSKGISSSKISHRDEG